MANQATIPITSRGLLHFRWNKSSSKTTTLATLYSPQCSFNLISGYDLLQAGIHFNTSKRCLEDIKGKFLCPIVLIGRNFCLHRSYLVPTKSYTVKAVQTPCKHSLEFIHRFLGHINVQSLRKSLKAKTITGLDYDSIDWSSISTFQCSHCMKGKARKHRHIVGHRTKYQADYAPFEYIHSDIFGPLPHLPSSAPKYFISFIDKNTRFRWVYPLKSKDAETTTSIFYEFIKMVKTQFSVRIKSFQLDRGSEYTNDSIRQVFCRAGIIPIFTSTRDSAAHGVAESSNLHFLNDYRTLLSSGGLSDMLWFEAVAFATLLRNSIINSTTNMSPRGKAGLCGIDASTLLPFGHPVVVLKYNTSSKLDKRGVDGYTLRPSDTFHGYLIFVPSTHFIVDTINYGVSKSPTPSSSNEPTTNVFDQYIESITGPYTSLTSATESDTISSNSNQSNQNTILGGTPSPTNPSPHSSKRKFSSGSSKYPKKTQSTLDTKTPPPSELINGDIDPSNILPDSLNRSSITTRSHHKSSTPTSSSTDNSSHTISGGYIY